MDEIKNPFYSTFIREKNILEGYDVYEERKLSDLKGYFEDENERFKMEQKENKIIYRVYKKNVPLHEGELLHCETIIEPGNVNGEFFMTKGHYHVNEKCAEIYYGQKGKGLLVLQNGSEFKCIEMNPDTIAYIPAGWGHRTINVSSDEPFVFFSIWPADSGYDYKRAVVEPFERRVIKFENSYKIK